jgi:hypothetical protein
MARAYAGVLAAVAISLAITRGLVLGMLPQEILVQCLWFFFVFAIIGFAIGAIAEKVVTESLESRFRSDMLAFRSRTSQPSPETTDQKEKLA